MNNGNVEKLFINGETGELAGWKRQASIDHDMERAQKPENPTLDSRTLTRKKSPVHMLERRHVRAHRYSERITQG